MNKVKICVPITGKTLKDIRRQAEICAATKADIVEWRYDLASELYADDFANDFKPVLKMIQAIIAGKKLLFTIRTDAEGGAYPYKASQAGRESYLQTILTAMDSGCVDFVDVEAGRDADIVHRLLLDTANANIATIASYHNFHFTPETAELLQKFRELAGTGADIVKTAYMPKDPRDVARLLYAVTEFRLEDHARHEIIAMSMGSLGKISRISGNVFGSDYTFAAADEASAPGQMPVELVRNLLDVFEG